ncbi:hypothetical protein AOLI_G00141580 [Acnodon oligacanthus]
MRSRAALAHYYNVTGRTRPLQSKSRAVLAEIPTNGGERHLNGKPTRNAESPRSGVTEMIHHMQHHSGAETNGQSHPEVQSRVQ